MQSGDLQVYETPVKGKKNMAVWLALFLSLAAGFGAYAVYF